MRGRGSGLGTVCVALRLLSLAASSQEVHECGRVLGLVIALIKTLLVFRTDFSYLM